MKVITEAEFNRHKIMRQEKKESVLACLALSIGRGEEWSDHKIAAEAGVTVTFATNVRLEWEKSVRLLERSLTRWRR